MKKNSSILILVGLALSLLVASPSQAQEKPAAMTPDMEAMMAKAKEAGTPGAEHQVLKVLEGNWNVTTQAWMKPGDQPQTSKGTTTLSWVLGGRFLKQDFKGDWAGQPFEGLGYLGYDKIKKEYVGIWMDSMSTGLFQGPGQYDASSKTLNQSGSFSCPMTGEKDTWFRAEWKLGNPDNVVHNMYAKDPTGKEFKSMEIVYQRVK